MLLNEILSHLNIWFNMCYFAIICFSHLLPLVRLEGLALWSCISWISSHICAFFIHLVTSIQTELYIKKKHIAEFVSLINN